MHFIVSIWTVKVIEEGKGVTGLEVREEGEEYVPEIEVEFILDKEVGN